MSERALSRQKRRKLLLGLVQREEISSQNQLQGRLAYYGLEVNQATLSRDLRELGIIKVPLGATGSRYVLPGADRSARQQYEETFRNLVLSIELSRNILVFKTGPGMAPAACLSMDNLHFEGILGTVAGDDTFIAVLREDDDWQVIHKQMIEQVGIQPLDD
jgi:transcriptional regulator of arginine metabolism